MKFLLINGVMQPEQQQSGGNGFLDWLNSVGDAFIEKESSLIIKPASSFLWERLVDGWHHFIPNIPDIMGYGAVLTGVLIVLGAMVGKGGMIKPIALYSGLLIIALLIMSGVKS